MSGCPSDVNIFLTSSEQRRNWTRKCKLHLFLAAANQKQACCWLLGPGPGPGSPASPSCGLSPRPYAREGLFSGGSEHRVHRSSHLVHLPSLTPCNPTAQQPLCIPQAQLDTKGGSAIPIRCAKMKFIFLLMPSFGFSSCPSQAARAADTSSFRWDVLITHKVDCSALCWDGQGFVSTD